MRLEDFYHKSSSAPLLYAVTRIKPLKASPVAPEEGVGESRQAPTPPPPPARGLPPTPTRKKKPTHTSRPRHTKEKNPQNQTRPRRPAHTTADNICSARPRCERPRRERHAPNSPPGPNSCSDAIKSATCDAGRREMRTAPKASTMLATTPKVAAARTGAGCPTHAAGRPSRPDHDTQQV